MKEHGIQNAIRNALAGHCLAFRANVGQAWTGEPHRLPNGDLLLKNPRPFSTGLPTGFSDLFGLVPVQVRPEHIGQVWARFFALEVKSPTGRLREQQEAFLRAVRQNGGLAGVARSEDDARKIVLDS